MYRGKSNLVLGFHGCDLAVMNQLLTDPDVLVRSERPFDWLGHGMYFWENNLERADEWAKDKKKRHQIQNPTVIGAVIDLRYCLDFTESWATQLLSKYFEVMDSEYQLMNLQLPQNKDIEHDRHKDKILRNLDCAVIEFIHKKISESNELALVENEGSLIPSFDSVRGLFTEGGPAFPGAGVQLKNHIQICIRNPNCIKGFFKPRQEVDFKRYG